MKKHIYAVIDTNVIVSALISSNPVSPTKRIIMSIFDGVITPVLSSEIIAEYHTVLTRPKFNFRVFDVKTMLDAIDALGCYEMPTTFHGELPDSTDRVFYEVSLTRDSYLITGNLKHFPTTPKVISPSEMMNIIDSSTN